MTDLNEVILVGRLTRDLGERDFGYIGNGNARAVLSVAVNRTKKVGENYEDEASYFEVVAWGKLAENLKPYFTKGKQLLIKGYLKQDRWEKDGEKKSRVSIVAESITLMGGKYGASDPSDPAHVVEKANPNAAVAAVANAFNGEIVEGGDFPEDILF